MKSSFLMVVFNLPAELGICSTNSYFSCLGKHYCETVLKINFLWMKGDNSCYFLLILKSVKICWLSKELVVLWSISCRLLWMMTMSMKLMTQTIDRILILKKLGRMREKWHQSGGNTAVLTVQTWAFLFFFLPLCFSYSFSSSILY